MIKYCNLRITLIPRKTTFKPVRNSPPKSLLGGYRVLDLTDEKAFFCGRILADLGADVIKVEPPGGDPARRLSPFIGNRPGRERGLYWLYYNLGKRGITLDLRSERGHRDFLKLAQGVDFIIESFPPGYLESLGLDYNELRNLNPGLIMTSVTPFGQSGPYRDYKATELTLMGMSGVQYLLGDPDRPPVWITFPTAYLIAGSEAAAASMIAFYHRQRTGFGQYIDVSIQAATSWLINPHLEFWSQVKIIFPRTTATHRILPFAKAYQRQMYPARDGNVNFYLAIGPALGKFTVNFGKWAKAVAGIDVLPTDIDPISPPQGIVQDFIDKLENGVARFTSHYSKEELYRAGMEYGFTLAPVNSIKDITESDQLEARGFWETVQPPELGVKIKYPGKFARLSETPVKLGLRAPLLGEHNAEVRRELKNIRDVRPVITGGNNNPREVFAGLKVADFSWQIAGPRPTEYLAEHGATVIRIESSRHLCATRTEGPFKDGVMGVNRSGPYLRWNVGKKGITLNLNHPEGRELAWKLIEWSDLVVENFTPGQMAKWGFSYDDIKKRKPDMIMLSSSNQGQDGPLSRMQGFGNQLVALSGFFDLTGWPDREPAGITWPFTDMLSPAFAVAALSGALDYRRRTGKGQYIDLSQYECSVHYLGPVIMDYFNNGRILGRMGNRNPLASPHGAFPCQGEDRWCDIAVFTENEWQALTAAMGKPAWAGETRFATLSKRKQNEDELETLIARWTIEKKPEEVMHTLQAAGVAAGMVSRNREVFEDPQLKHRNQFVELTYPEFGTFPHESQAYIMSETPAIIRHVPMMGEHTYEIMTELLGLSDERFAELAGDGVFD